MRTCRDCKQTLADELFAKSQLAIKDPKILPRCNKCYYKYNRHNQKKKRRAFCDCGRPATVKLESDWICARCDEIEKKLSRAKTTWRDKFYAPFEEAEESRREAC